MTRLVPLLQERLSAPLSIDSPNAAALEAGLKAHRGRPLLNSISGESAKLEALLPLVGEYRPRIIALCLDDDGLPGSPEKSLEIALRLAGLLTERGLAPGDIFLDPLVRPVGVDPGSVRRFLDALEMITSRLPGFAAVAGLSNVSFGMPARRLLNRTFLVLCLERGLDAAILDPLDEEIMDALSAAECLLGGQEPIRRFLKRARQNKA
jgi:5-methyltetrahydrofolate--homocysteine methyltransferase